MIEVVLVFVGALLVLPAGLSFVADGERKPTKKAEPAQQVEQETLPEPEPIFVARLVATKRTVVTVVPVCSDEGSEDRLKTASLEYLENVAGLPDETVFEVAECAEEGVVDIEIVEKIEKIKADGE